MVVDIGSITGNGTINCSSLSNYQNLTVDNFLVNLISIPNINIQCDAYPYNAAGVCTSAGATVSKSYNQETGVLTVKGLSITLTVSNSGIYPKNGTVKLSASIYCIL